MKGVYGMKRSSIMTALPDGATADSGMVQDRACAAGGEAFISGDCGMREFTELAVEEATYDWLKETVCSE